MWLLDFLFGKKPAVEFTGRGKVTHDLGDKKWDSWKSRFSKNPGYDWHQHVGKKSGISPYRNKSDNSKTGSKG